MGGPIRPIAPVLLERTLHAWKNIGASCGCLDEDILEFVRRTGGIGRYEPEDCRLVKTDSSGDVETTFKISSLVVCAHSNLALDTLYHAHEGEPLEIRLQSPAVERSSFDLYGYWLKAYDVRHWQLRYFEDLLNNARLQVEKNINLYALAHFLQDVPLKNALINVFHKNADKLDLDAVLTMRVCLIQHVPDERKLRLFLIILIWERYEKQARDKWQAEQAKRKWYKKKAEFKDLTLRDLRKSYPHLKVDFTWLLVVLRMHGRSIANGRWDDTPLGGFCSVPCFFHDHTRGQSKVCLCNESLAPPGHHHKNEDQTVMDFFDERGDTHYHPEESGSWDIFLVNWKDVPHPEDYRPGEDQSL